MPDNLTTDTTSNLVQAVKKPARKTKTKVRRVISKAKMGARKAAKRASELKLQNSQDTVIQHLV